VLKYSLLLTFFAVLLSHSARAQISVADDWGNVIVMPHAAKRVVALSPHAVELVYAVGAGSTLVAAVDYSDTPHKAQQLPRVGSHAGFDLERIAALKPDLIIAWPMGGERQLQRLESLGVPIYRSAPTRLEQIGSSLIPLGKLLGYEAEAQKAQQVFQQRLQVLRQQYARPRPIRIFYQVWAQPLMTIGGHHTISDALQVCGGHNIFSDLTIPAPSVSREAVFQRHPEIVIVSASAVQTASLKKSWKNLPVVPVENSALTLPVPRMLDAIAEMCQKIARARQAAE
jgi:iron complex transport system substrate-binding protein